MTTADPTTAPAAASTPASGLYRRVWRWHFFAGLACVPFVLSLAITGMLYLFHDRIDDLVYARQLLRTPATASAPARAPSRLIAGALQAYPGAAAALTLPADARHNAQVDVRRPGGGTLQVFVDPATGRVAGAIDADARIMNTVKHVHSLAIAGTLGRTVIEIVAGWIVVLMATGIYLWWPRGRRAGVVAIRSGAQGRVWWRDLHAVTGAFGGAIVLFLALTGMPWSVFWGANVNAWTTAHGLGVPNGVWTGVPKSTLPPGALGELPWAQQQAPVPASRETHEAHEGHEGHEGHGGMAMSGPALPAAPNAIGPDAAAARFAAIGMDGGYRLVLPRDAHGVFSAVRMPGQVEAQRVVHLDQYSGKVLMDIGPADVGAVGRVTQWGVAVHQGAQYGTANLVVMLAGCLALIALCVSGIAAWWLRRPAGRLAAPARRDGDRVARGVLLIAAVLGCVFPLLGASMLVVLALDVAATAFGRRVVARAA
jgi:uncharacterized iron-regulated membrane protein